MSLPTYGFYIKKKRKMHTIPSYIYSFNIQLYYIKLQHTVYYKHDELSVQSYVYL